MIKKETGVLTALSKGINSISRDDAISGMQFVGKLDEKLNEKLTVEKDKDEDLGR